jgi:Trk K+ transport system NAD-binding subunit
MNRWGRRFLANLYYLRQPFVEFLPSLLLLFAVLLVGSVCFHHWYVLEDGERPSYAEALYITFCLVFMEHSHPELPGNPVLAAFYFLLPVLGLVVILDGVVRFGSRVLGRGATGTEWVRAMAKTYRDHVILCGLGRVGLRVLEQLLRLGEDVVILEKDPDNHNIAFAEKHGVPVRVGAGREEGILDDLNVQQAKSIILATDDDLANLELAMDARKAKPDIRVVLRMFDQELAAKIRDAFDIKLAFSTASLAAPLFATSSSDRSIENSFYVGNKLMVVATLVVNADSDLIGKKIGDFGPENNMFVLSHTREGEETHFPPADTTFQPNDRLVVQSEPETLKSLHEWNRDT